MKPFAARSIAIFLLSSSALAQPNGMKCAPDNAPVSLIVPYPPGGSVDILARTMQHVIVENRPGGGGVVGASAVAMAQPNGRTLLLSTLGGIAFPTFLVKQLPFDPLKDLVPIALIADIPMVVVVNASFPPKSLQELVSNAKANPGRVNVATVSAGSVDDLATALLATTTGATFQRIPYKGTGPALTDTLTGQTQMMITPLFPVIQHIRAGKLKALAVAGRSRVAAEPNIPTAAEAGVPGFDATNWIGLFAPRGTPPDRTACYRKSAQEYYRLPNVLERMREMGLEMGNRIPPEQFPTYLQTEIQKWARIARNLGYKPE